MEIIVHPTIKSKKVISYNHIIKLKENLDIYIGNKETREAEYFDYIIEICNENEIYEQLLYTPINILTLNFNDVRTYNILEQKEKVKKFINECQGKLLIHCGEGVSRSPSVLIMYLIDVYNYSYSDSYNLIMSKRFIKPNIGFIKRLKSLSNDKI